MRAIQQADAIAPIKLMLKQLSRNKSFLNLAPTVLVMLGETTYWHAHHVLHLATRYAEKTSK